MSLSGTNMDNHPILGEAVDAAVKVLKKKKSAGVDNIPSELVQAGCEETISALHTICNKIWKTGEWPTVWSQSLIITLPKERQSTTVSELPHYKFDMSPKQSHAENITQQTEATSRSDYCRRAGRLQGWVQHN